MNVIYIYKFSTLWSRTDITSHTQIRTGSIWEFSITVVFFFALIPNENHFPILIYPISLLSLIFKFIFTYTYWVLPSPVILVSISMNIKLLKDQKKKMENPSSSKPITVYIWSNERENH